MSEALDLARRLLDAGPPDALARVVRERSLALRFAGSLPTQATAVDDLTAELAVICHGHVGRASTNDTGADALRTCAQAAHAAARAAARGRSRGSFPGWPAPAAEARHAGFDADTARLEPEIGSAALAEVFSTAADQGAAAGGIWTAGDVETAVASSGGTAVSDRVTDAFLKVVATAAPGATGYAAQTAVSSGGVDAGEVAGAAVRTARAVAAGERAGLAAGTYPMVLSPHAVRELLWVLATSAFDGRAHAEGRGALAGRLGTRVAAPSVNLSDSPRYAATIPRAIDAEGVPKAPIPLIQDGVAHRVVHDTRSAALAATASSGHAAVPGGGPPPFPSNLVLVGGGAAGEDELCAPVKRGVYVTRFWYTNVVQEAAAHFTATTRDGTFLIEDGELTSPLGDLRVTDSALGALARVEALGARPLLTSDGELYGRRFASGSVCPPLRTKLTVTGAA